MKWVDHPEGKACVLDAGELETLSHIEESCAQARLADEFYHELTSRLSLLSAIGRICRRHAGCYSDHERHQIVAKEIKERLLVEKESLKIPAPCPLVTVYQRGDVLTVSFVGSQFVRDVWHQHGLDVVRFEDLRMPTEYVPGIGKEVWMKNGNPDWYQTAKRLRDHNLFMWRFPMAFIFEGRRHRVSEGYDGAHGIAPAHDDAVPDLDDWGTRSELLRIGWEAAGPLTIGRAHGTKSGQISVAGMTAGGCPAACADTLGEALAEFVFELFETWR